MTWRGWGLVALATLCNTTAVAQDPQPAPDPAAGQETPDALPPPGDTSFGLPPPDAVQTTPPADAAASPPRAVPPPADEALPTTDPPEDAVTLRQFYPYRCRPLTLPQQTLRIDAFLFYSYVGDASTSSDTFVSVLGGLAYAATPDLEIGGVLLPLTLSPGGEYNQPSLYGLYRFVASQRFELGGRLTLAPGLGDDFFFFDTALEALVRAGAVRFDVKAGLAVQTSDPARTIVHGELFATLQLTERFFVGVQTGAQLYDGENLDVPLGFYVGLTPSGSLGPGGDVRLGISFPEIRDGVELYTVGMGATFFSYLGQ